MKYLNNFWRTLETPLIDFKDELNLQWTKHCVRCSCVDNANANNDNITFIIKGTKIYVPVVTLSSRNNPKLSFLAKDLKNQHIGIIIKRKVGIKIRHKNINIFSNQTL